MRDILVISALRPRSGTIGDLYMTRIFHFYFGSHSMVLRKNKIWSCTGEFGYHARQQKKNQTIVG